MEADKARYLSHLQYLLSVYYVWAFYSIISLSTDTGASSNVCFWYVTCEMHNAAFLEELGTALLQYSKYEKMKGKHQREREFFGPYDEWVLSKVNSFI